MVSCSEFLAEFGNYLDGGVTPELHRDLEVHVAHCSTCQVIVDSAKKTLKVITDVGEFDLAERLPEPAVDQIMRRIRQSTVESDES